MKKLSLILITSFGLFILIFSFNAISLGIASDTWVSTEGTVSYSEYVDEGGSDFPDVFYNSLSITQN